MGQAPPRLTHQSLRLLKVFLESPSSEFYGTQLMEFTDLRSGSLYPILLRLEETQILESRWEEDEPAELGRPRRRLYKITADGKIYVRQVLAELAPTPRLVPASVHQ